MEDDYHELLKINRHNLDHEWEANPGLYMRYAEKAAIALREKNEIDAERKIMKARLGRKYRLQLESERAKVTDPMIVEMIRTDPEYKRLTEDLIAAIERWKIMDAAMWSFQQRKESLEHIQDGIQRGLFSMPEQRPRNESDEIRDKINERRQRR